jgi:hypothetical protein
VLLGNHELNQIINELQVKTSEKKILWRLGSEGYSVNLSSGILFVVGKINDEVFFRVIVGIDTVAGELKSHVQDNQPVKFLLDAVETQVSRRVFSDIIGSIGDADMLGKTAPITMAPYYGPHPLLTGLEPWLDPNQMLPNQADEFFKRIKGRWKLDFSRGIETVIIDENGNYTIEGEKHPKWVLRLIAHTPDFSKVEVGKYFPEGKRLHVETLEVSPPPPKRHFHMKGVAQHDQTGLTYTRLE